MDYAQGGSFVEIRGTHQAEDGAEAFRLVEPGAGAHAQLDAGRAQLVGQLRHLVLQRRGAEQRKYLAQQLQVHRAHGMDARAADVEVALLLLDTRAHVADDRGVLAAQALQLDEAVTREGGEVGAAGDASKTKPKFNNLTEGEQKFADGIKLPGQTAPANATTAAIAA